MKEYLYSLNEEDFKLLNKIYLDNQDVLFYAKAKQEREKASYSTKIIFNKKSVFELRKETLNFVNKCREILEN
jgi:cysteine sulfinate desulfinase/cysteine desulfurase-like protein